MVYNEAIKQSIYRYRAKDPERWTEYYATYRQEYREAHREQYNAYQRSLMNKRWQWQKIAKEFRNILVDA